jgi:hypothetical protein
MWEPRRLTTLWASKAYYKESFFIHRSILAYLFICGTELVGTNRKLLPCNRETPVPASAVTPTLLRPPVVFIRPPQAHARKHLQRGQDRFLPNPLFCVIQSFDTVYSMLLTSSLNKLQIICGKEVNSNAWNSYALQNRSQQCNNTSQ